MSNTFGNIHATTQIVNGDRFIEADGTVAFTGNQDFGGFRATGLADPVDPQDAVTLSRLDSVTAGLDPKEAVRLASTQNVDLSSSTSTDIDGTTPNDGDRILLKDQSTGSENGIYIAVTGTDPSTWVRAEDADEDSEVDGGEHFFVKEGNTYAETGWVITSDNAVVGTDTLAFSQFTGAGSFNAGDGLTQSGNTIDFAAGDNSLTVNADDALVNLDSNSVLVTDTNGIKLADGNAGEFLIGKGTGTPTAYTALSGDISSVTAAGAVTVNTTGALESTPSGVGMSTSASAGQVVIAKASGQPAFTTIGGDATLAEDGTLSITNDFQKKADNVIEEDGAEVPATDGTKTDWTLSNSWQTDTLAVYVNGNRVKEGDVYTVDTGTNTVSFNQAPPTPYDVTFDYVKETSS